MKLTRRDAVAALAGAGIVLGSGAAAHSRRRLDGRAADAGETDGDDEAGGPPVEETLTTLVATAEVVYPSDVSGVAGFVETYSLGRIRDREAYRRDVRKAAGELDTHARAWTDADGFAALPVDERDDLLREMGVHTADERPDGTVPERVRYYVVNELLYALYASPTGGELVGIENPIGHPGGTESYRRGPR